MLWAWEDYVCVLSESKKVTDLKYICKNKHTQWEWAYIRTVANAFIITMAIQRKLHP